MKNKIKVVALGMTLLLANVSVGSAQDLQKDEDAASKGGFAAASSEFRLLAAQGNAAGGRS